MEERREINTWTLILSKKKKDFNREKKSLKN